MGGAQGRGAAREGHHGEAAAGSSRPFPEAVIFPFNIPTLSGFGAASGFNFLLQDRSGSLTVAQLGEQTRKFLAAARQRPELGTVFTSFDPNYPQVKVELDREKARTLGVPVNEVFQALSAALGGSYVNDFNRFGRLYRVYVQADARDPAEGRGHRQDLRPLEDHQRDGPAVHAGHHHARSPGPS